MITAADRKRAYRAGWSTIKLKVHLPSAAEALGRAGYMHPDNDTRVAVQCAAQEHFDDMVRDVGGDVPCGTSGDQLFVSVVETSNEASDK